MDAHAALRAQLNVIHGELAARGIHSAKIENATYSIETLCQSYMAPDVQNNWEGLGLTKKERDFADLLYSRLGKTVTKDSLYNVLYFDRVHGGPEDKIIDVFICKLRHKGFGIREKMHPSRILPFEILTDWGIGYKMVHRSPGPVPEPIATALHELAA